MPRDWLVFDASLAPVHTSALRASGPRWFCCVECLPRLVSAPLASGSEFPRLTPNFPLRSGGSRRDSLPGGAEAASSLLGHCPRVPRDWLVFDASLAELEGARHAGRTPVRLTVQRLLSPQALAPVHTSALRASRPRWFCCVECLPRLVRAPPRRAGEAVAPHPPLQSVRCETDASPRSCTSQYIAKIRFSAPRVIRPAGLRSGGSRRDSLPGGAEAASSLLGHCPRVPRDWLVFDASLAELEGARHAGRTPVRLTVQRLLSPQALAPVHTSALRASRPRVGWALR